jgi:DNA (cytosine-5)-methyltransferase 1
VRWPRPTHSRRPSMFEQPWRSAAECIRWDVPAASIFARPRPLAEATCRRIAAGIRRFVLEAAEPFIVTIDHQSNPKGMAGAAAPLSAITAKARHAVVAPVIGVLRNNATAFPVNEPTRTITAGGEHQAVIAPTLIEIGYGEREGQAPRARGLHRPLGTVVTARKHAIVAAFLAQHNTGVIGRGAAQPVSTILTAGCHQQIVTASLAADDAAGAAGAERVAAFLIRYNGTNVGQDLRDPLGAATTKPRFALVQVAGVPHVICDIGMRMLLPEELAAAQGLPADYRWMGADGSPLSKTATVRLIGNSVSPPPAEALLRANLETPARRMAA